MYRFFVVVLFLVLSPNYYGFAREVKLKFMETSDIHGNFFPYNFIAKKEWGGSLARVYSVVESEREEYGENLFLLDNGDLLQGQPSAYYYNFIDTVSMHLASEVMNFMGYDIGNMGNHDVETGRAVFDRWIRQCDFPILGANVLLKESGEPYLKPYEVFERDGLKIAVLGMITPAIPVWLPETLWSGLSFADMEETARKWMKIIKEREKPDVVVGIFHAGSEARTLSGKFREDASMEVAKRVPGFDVVMMGHDHRKFCEKVANVDGDSVLLINPASNGRVVAVAELSLDIENGKVNGKSVSGELIDTDGVEPSREFMDHFSAQYNTVERFVSEKVGAISETISSRQSYFGSSAFMDFIHSLQLDLTGADISFAAPLSFDVEIKAGDITVSDMFNLCRYENMLYTMELTGAEVKGFLEESYYLWSNQMTSSDDHILLLKERITGGKSLFSFVNPSFNFDSAAGILYTVDVTKPRGEKVTITSMANGEPFDMERVYRVALNSYRGNGGGELLTKGAGIPQDDLKSRLVCSTEKDLRYYMIQYIKSKGTLAPKPLNQWRFIPDDFVVPAIERDYNCLFGE